MNDFTLPSTKFWRPSRSILHYDGKTLTAVPSGTMENLAAIWGADATHIWAVGQKGSVLFSDGRSWSSVAKVGDELHAIWGAGANNVWVVGGTLNVSAWSHWNGSTWSSVVGGTSGAGLYAVDGTDADNVWAVGEYGQSYRWKGDAFSLVGRVSNNDPRLRAVKVYGDRVVAWSEDSTFNWDGAKWSSGEATGALSAESAPHSEIVWTTTVSGSVRRSDSSTPEIATGSIAGAYVTQAGQAFVALRDRTLLTKEASTWKQVGVTATAPEVLYDKTALGETSDGLLIAAAQTGDTVRFRSFGGTASRDLPSLVDIQPRLVGGKTASDVWTYTGTLWHLSGTQWTQQNPPGMTLTAFDVTHGDVPWFVGEVNGNAAVATYAAGAFTPRPIPASKNVALKAVYAKGKEAWVAGIFSDVDNAREEGGVNVWPVSLRLWHYTGTSWEVLPPPPLAPQNSARGLRDVRMTFSPTNELVLGISGREDVTKNVFVSTGASWSERVCPVPGIGHLGYVGKELWVTSSDLFGLGVDTSGSGLLRALP